MTSRYRATWRLTREGVYTIEARTGPGVPCSGPPRTTPCERLLVSRPRTLCLLLIASASATLNRSAGLIDDGRHDHPDPHRPPPWCQNPALPRAREPRVAAPTGRPPAYRAASAAANANRLGAAVPPVGRRLGLSLRERAHGQLRDGERDDHGQRSCMSHEWICLRDFALLRSASWARCEHAVT
jgi:hypothetical protein